MKCNLSAGSCIDAIVNIVEETLINHVLDALSAGATLVTATRRLGRAWEAAYAKAQIESGLTVWATPRIVSIPAWLEQLWSQAEDQGLVSARVLDSFAERALWETYTADDAEQWPLLDGSTAAALAQDAYALLCQQNAKLSDLPNFLSMDGVAFKRWATRFERDCRRNDWLPRAAMECAIAPLIEDGRLPCVGPIYFVGFDRFSPAIEMLQGALDRAAVHTHILAGVGPNNSATVTRCAASDPNDELRLAALWARRRIVADRGKQIGIVVLDLDKRRAEVEQIMRDTLAGCAPWEHAEFSSHVNISLGQSLSQLPAVQAALWALTLCVDELPWQSASALLRSNVFGNIGSCAVRALQDLTLREAASTSMTLDRFTKCLSGHFDSENPNPWSTLRESVNPWPKKALPSDWRRHFDDVLKRLGWLIGDAENAVDHALQIRLWWHQAMDQVSGLDAWLGPVTAPQTLGHFRRILRDEIVQYETPLAPIQVLGGLEAGGLTFDGVWIAGASDDKLPAPVHPNPFLPAQWQRQNNFPRSSPQSEFEYAATQVRHFCAMADDVVFSYASMEKDQHFQPSPLITEFAAFDSVELADLKSDLLSMTAISPAIIDTVTDVTGPSLESGATVAGGTAALKWQSACPFQGFARVQLRVEPVPTVVEGFSAAERGTLVHEALRFAWNRIRCHSELIRLEHEALYGLLEQEIDGAVDRVLRRISRPIERRLIDLERRRLVSLLMQWLDIERNRAPFEMIENEEKRTLRVGELTLTGQVDRVDQLPTGERIVFDYKTGVSRVMDWFGERPREPQLPLYAICDSRPVDGLVFAQVRTGEMQFRGLTEQADWVPGVKPFSDSDYSHNGSYTWRDQLSEWRGRMEVLATELAAGVAHVSPRDDATTCEHCQLMSLCRVYEQKQLRADDDNDEEAESDDRIA